MTRQLLTAARFAHTHGIVHRDLKPLNVLIDREGRLRVTDFGIARAGASEITQTGSVMGTAQYLSPEQAQGLDVTPASDLYSIGIILYEALTGRVPFEGDSAVAVALKQVSEQPVPPSRINPAVPPALDAVVMRALAKDPVNRFATADEFLAALDAAEADPATPAASDTARFVPVAPPPPELRRRRGAPLALALDPARAARARARRPRGVGADAPGRGRRADGPRREGGPGNGATRGGGASRWTWRSSSPSSRREPSSSRTRAPGPRPRRARRSRSR